MAKRESARRDTKERILRSALEVFGRQGYAATSVDEVAAAAGVTKGAVYYYFADKADLGADLQRLLWEELTHAALRGYDPEQPFVANALSCFAGFLQHIRDLPAARGFLREAWVTPALDPSGRAAHEAAHELVRSLLEQAMRNGEVVELEADALARVLMGALMEATLHVMGSGDPDGTLRVVEHLLVALVPVTERAR